MIKNSEIGHGTESKTAYINWLKTDIGYLVDTPGHFDTKGLTVEVAN